MAFSAMARVAGFGSDTAFLSSPQRPSLRAQPAATVPASTAQLQSPDDFGEGSKPLLRTGAFLLSGIGAAAVAFAQKRDSRRTSGRTAPAASPVIRKCGLIGEDLSVPGDSFVALGLAHCFETVDGHLQDVWVLEPITASTVEVIENGAQTSYETFIGTTVAQVLAEDLSAYPEALANGHEVRFCDDLEFRTGCAARTWMRDHASTVVRNFAPLGEVRTDFNTSTEHKRILNFVHEVKDSDNIKQDMSIDVYGRDEEGESNDGDADAQIAELYNV